MQVSRTVLEIESALGRKIYTLTPNRPNSFEELHIDFQQLPESDGQRYTIFLHPKMDLKVLRLEAELSRPGSLQSPFLANGYQSRSDARMRMPGEGPAFRDRFLNRSADERIPGMNTGKPAACSWTYTYWTEPSGAITLAGSLNEETGFTIFQPEADVLRVRKDLDSLELSHSFPALDFWTGTGPEHRIFDNYFSLFFKNAYSRPEPASFPETALGLVAGRHLTPGFSEKTVLEMAKAAAGSGLPFRYFLIDDGWQTSIGDWRSIAPEFPSGMGGLAADIRASGLIPGLRLAPFVAAEGSDLLRKNPDWFLKNSSGKISSVGRNRAGRGRFYALNFYHPGVQDYLSGVFHVILEKWGYGLLKLDFLFAACLAPPPGKTRGQVMHDVMEYLRRQTGNRLLLAGGVPLSAAFGWANFCEISAHDHRSAVPWFGRLLGLNERSEALSALRCSIHRRHLNRRAFLNAPGSFSLQSDGTRHGALLQNTILTIHILLGALLVTPDDPGAYSPEQRSELEDALQWRGARVLSVAEYEKELYRIDFEQGTQQFTAWCNLSKRATVLPENSNGRMDLRPFESIVLKKPASSN